MKQNIRRSSAQKTVLPSLSPVSLAVILSLAPFMTGLFFEWQSAACSIGLIILLLYDRKAAGRLFFPTGSGAVFSFLLSFLFLCSPLWAVDKGMALWGFVKFLPVPLFALALAQTDPNRRNELWRPLPWCGAAMTVLSVILGFFFHEDGLFYVNSRLCGFFQYPNSYAMYLLIGALSLAYEKWTPKRLFCLGILLTGIILSGSRAVFVLTVMAFFFVIPWKTGDKKEWLFIISILGVLAACVILYGVITGNRTSIGRIFTLSFSSSTFLGRFLYFQDAVPVIMKHPLGLGYLGYSFTQGSFQSGVYSVTHVHNDLLQTFLDTGWIPGAALIWALIDAFRHYSGNRIRRILLIVLIIHGMFDFDFQFISLALYGMALLEIDGTAQPKPERLKFFPVFCGFLTGLCLWIGTASFLNSNARYETAVSVWKGDTTARMELLAFADDWDEAEQQADIILGYNRDVSLAWSVKAGAAFARGDADKMIAFKKEALRLSKYSAEEWEDYRNMLRSCIELYDNSGDIESSDTCRVLLNKSTQEMENILDSTSRLGMSISDKPELQP